MNRYWACNDQGYLFSWTKECPQWIDIKSELDMLYSEGKAEWGASGYLVPHETAVTFDREERELLTLPVIYPYGFSVRTSNLLHKADFRIHVQLIDMDNRPFINPKVTGSFVRIHDEACYMLNAAQFELLKVAALCHADADGVTGADGITSYNLRSIANIKEYAGFLNVSMDEVFRQYSIVAPKFLSLSIEESTDPKDAEKPYYAVPLLLDEDGFRYEDDVQSHFREQFLEKPHSGIYYKKRDSKTGKRLDFAFSQEQKEGLEQIKKQKHMSKKEVKQLCLTPERFFPSDAFLFDLSDYSKRVTGYGTFLSKVYPYLKGLENGWILPEGEFMPFKEIIETEMPEVTPENAAELSSKIRKASTRPTHNGAHTIEYKWKKYLVTPDLVRKVEEVLTRARENHSNTIQEQGALGTGGKSTGKESLLGITNIERVEYEKTAAKLHKKQKKERLQHISAKVLTGPIQGVHSEFQLYGYQYKGVQWMLKNWIDGYSGVLLADDMGLGKTLQALAFVSQIKMAYGQEKMPSVLVVAPVALLNNWKEEFERFVKDNIFEDLVSLYSSHFTRKYTKQGNGVDTYYDFSSISENHIVLTTYETLRLYDTSFGRISWGVIVLDEAQKIKSPGAAVSNAVKSMKYQFGLAITGTPVENAWLDLWSIMDFVEPGKLYSMKEFRDHFQNRLKYIRKDAAAIQKLGQELENNLEPLFLRRHKQDCLEGLPQKTIKPYKVPMGFYQRNLYLKLFQEGKKAKGKKGAMLNVIAALRDISLCPYLLDNEESIAKRSPQEFFTSSGRLQALFWILCEIKQKDEKVLLFITSRKMQRLVKGFLEKVFSIQIFTPINGEMKGDKRLEVVDKFNEQKGFSILILSAEAGGVGLNIVGANHVIHLSRCWNPAKEDQATDRAYRIGQTKPVHVYLPMSILGTDRKGASFDEKLDELLQFKRTISKSAIFPAGEFEADIGDLYNSLFEDDQEISNVNIKPEYYTLEKIERTRGVIFEDLVARMYDQIGYRTAITSQTGDFGADVVAQADHAAQKSDLLIQCKRRKSDDKLGLDVVREICAALPVYSQNWGRQFRGMVVTNAEGFTDAAKKLAEANGIQLIAGAQLGKMLERHPVSII